MDRIFLWRSVLTELDLQCKFRVSNKNLVSIDISKNFDIEPAIYRSILKNSGIEPALLRVHTVLLMGTVWILDLQRKYQTKFRYRSVSNKT